jgi:hypothetical protein
VMEDAFDGAGRFRARQADLAVDGMEVVVR